MTKLYAVLSLVSLFLVSLVSSPAARAQIPPAEKGAVGTTLHFTMDVDEIKDIAISLPKGDYVIQADLRLANVESSNIQMTIDLLKTNGVIVQNEILKANAVHRVCRIARPFHISTALGARLRVKNGSKQLEYWLTVFPAARRPLVPFPFGGGEMKPLAVGTDNGKGGVLPKQCDDGFFVFHKIALPAGNYDVSLHLKQKGTEGSNLQATLRLLDKYGVPLENDWTIPMNEEGIEARKDRRLVVVRPATIYFMVTNDNDTHAYDYTVGIEKAPVD